MAYFEERVSIDKVSGKKTVKCRAMVRLKGHPTACRTFANKTLARRWVQKTEAAIREGRDFKTAEAKKHTLNELIDRYLRENLRGKPKDQVDKKTTQLKWWKSKLGSFLLSDVTSALIYGCSQELLQEVTYRGTKRSNATVVRYLAALSHACRVAINDYGWMDSNPVSKVNKPSEPRGIVRFLDTAERERLLEACKMSSNADLYVIVVIALATGMRKGEILNLKWQDVDLENERIILHKTKNGERRVVPIKGHGLDLLRKKLQDRKNPSELVFPGKRLDEPLDIRSPWEAALAKANIINFRFHDLRHSAASYLAMNKASATEIAEILGHKTLQMVKRYSHLSESHVASVLEKMNEKIFG